MQQLKIGVFCSFLQTKVFNLRKLYFNDFYLTLKISFEKEPFWENVLLLPCFRLLPHKNILSIQIEFDTCFEMIHLYFNNFYLTLKISFEKEPFWENVLLLPCFRLLPHKNILSIQIEFDTCFEMIHFLFKVSVRDTKHFNTKQFSFM